MAQTRTRGARGGRPTTATPDPLTSTDFFKSLTTADLRDGFADWLEQDEDRRAYMRDRLAVANLLALRALHRTVNDAGRAIGSLLDRTATGTEDTADLLSELVERAKGGGNTVGDDGDEGADDEADFDGAWADTPADDGEGWDDVVPEDASVPGPSPMAADDDVDEAGTEILPSNRPEPEDEAGVEDPAPRGKGRTRRTR